MISQIIWAMVCREYLAVPILSVLPVKIFAKVPYGQHYYGTLCLDKEILGMDRVVEHGSCGDGCFGERLAAAEMF